MTMSENPDPTARPRLTLRRNVRDRGRPHARLRKRGDAQGTYPCDLASSGWTSSPAASSPQARRAGGMRRRVRDSTARRFQPRGARRASRSSSSRLSGRTARRHGFVIDVAGCTSPSASFRPLPTRPRSPGRPTCRTARRPMRHRVHLSVRPTTASGSATAAGSAANGNNAVGAYRRPDDNPARVPVATSAPAYRAQRAGMQPAGYPPRGSRGTSGCNAIKVSEKAALR